MSTAYSNQVRRYGRNPINIRFVVTDPCISYLLLVNQRWWLILMTQIDLILPIF